MAEYEFQGVNKEGKKVTGRLDVASEGDLRMALRGQGIRPVRISTVGALNRDIGTMLRGGVNVSSASLVAFTRQLQVLTGSGVPLVQSLEVLGQQTGDKNLATIVSAIREKVSGGSYLWEALGEYPKVFPRLYIALIRAGESSGSMDQMLKRLCRYLEDSERIRKILRGAAMYPIIVSCIGIGVVSLMLIFVIPKFEELLTSNGQELPGPTQFVIQLSHFVMNNILFIIGGAFLTVYVIRRYISSKEGRAVLDRVVFTMPLFGNLAQKAGVARFSRTMQTLLSSGVNLLDAIDICKATIGNSVLEATVSRIRSDVESGKTLGSVVGKIAIFPKMAAQMIAVGESTGNLDKMLEKVADFYEEEVEVLVGSLTKLIEPLVLVVLGGAVGGLMIAMYLPIFKMAGAAGGAG